MKHSKLIFTIVFILCYAISFSAEANHFVGINVMGGFPQKEFKNNADNGWGGSAGYAYGFGGNMPVKFLISPALALAYNPLASRFSHSVSDAET